MIAAVCWVPKGAAKPVPQAVEPPGPDELQALIQLHEQAAGSMSDEEAEEIVDEEDEMNFESNSSSNAVATALNAARALGCVDRKINTDERLHDIAAGLAELDMDNYDNEDEGIELFGNGGLGAAYYSNNEMDPYLTSKDSDDEEEIEDMTIKPTDLILLTARNEDDVSHLEMWVYEDFSEEHSQNMYVHHDVMLSAFPLSLAWLDCDIKGSEKGNYVAVGTMEPEIEIWDLDILDAVEPAAVLGGYKKPSKLSSTKKRKKKKGKKLKEGSHSDAVLSLAWNREYRNVVASASADHSVKIWDVVMQKCEHTICCHSNKVQAVAWNVHEPTALLSGSFDRTLSLMDMRAPTHQGIKWSIPADVEALAWDPHVSYFFVVSLEDGTVVGHDIRMVTPASASDSSPGSGGKPLFTIHAHDKAVCTISYNTAAPHLLATGSTDKTVKLWDLKDNQPTCLCAKNPKVGAVFVLSFCRDSPFLLALGGSNGNLEVWDTLTEADIARRFGKCRLQRAS